MSMHGVTDVFPIHRGPDAKMGFVADLCKQLPGRNVFQDQHHLHGLVLLPTIVEKLQEAAIILVVLSPDFHQSAWCLEELRMAYSMRGSKRIRIVFHTVTPGSLSSLDLQQAQLDYLKHFTLTPPEMASHTSQWREALSFFGQLGGWEYSPRGRYVVWCPSPQLSVHLSANINYALYSAGHRTTCWLMK